MWLRVRASGLASAVLFTASALLYPARRQQACAPTIGWGDVNVDGHTDIVDAQQLARAVLGLPVINVAAISVAGDVTGDGVANILDAQQIARSSVGLSAVARIGTLKQLPSAPAQIAFTDSVLALAISDSVTLTPALLDVVGRPMGACASVTWSTSSGAITVSAGGVVRGVQSGTAMLTASVAGAPSVASTISVQVASVVAMAQVGNQGATLAVPGTGISLSVSPGALASTRPIFVTVDSIGVAALPFGATQASVSVRLLPDGLAFTAPVTLSLPLANIATGRDTVSVYQNTGDSLLVWQETTVDVQRRVAIVTLAHFSTYVAVIGTAWTPGTFTYAFESPASGHAGTGATPLSATELSTELDRAVSMWNPGLRSAGITLTRGSASNADVLVRLVPSSSLFRNQGAVSGYQLLEENSLWALGVGSAASRTLLLNDAVQWSSLEQLANGQAGNSLISTLAHQLGHLIGLRHPPNCATPTGAGCVQPPLMAPFAGSGSFVGASCTDLAGFAALYNVPSAASKCPGQVVASSPTSVSVVAGQPVTPPPSVTVFDQVGSPLEGVPVLFRSSASGLSGVAQLTDAHGVAQAGGWIPPASAGSYSANATLSGQVAVQFTAAVQVVSESVHILDGDSQSALIGQPVSRAPAVRVTNSLGAPVAGRGVTFQITAGGGTIVGATTTTDAAGTARASEWHLGNAVGINQLSATVSGITGSGVSFVATATQAGLTTSIAAWTVTADAAHGDSFARTIDLANVGADAVGLDASIDFQPYPGSVPWASTSWTTSPPTAQPGASASLTVQIQRPALLTSGVYRASIVIRSSPLRLSLPVSQWSVTAVIPVELDVSLPYASAQTGTLTFASTSAAPFPRNASIAVTNTGGSLLSIIPSIRYVSAPPTSNPAPGENTSWLGVQAGTPAQSPINAISPGASSVVAISANAFDLAPGTYVAELTLHFCENTSSCSGVQPDIVVGVVFEVQGPVLVSDRRSFTFTGVHGDAVRQRDSITVTNVGSNAAVAPVWSVAFPDAPTRWISLGQPVSIIPVGAQQVITLSATFKELAPGTYHARLHLSAHNLVDMDLGDVTIIVQ